MNSLRYFLARYLNICNIYILIWILYTFHWQITGQFPFLESISNILLGVNLLISLIAFVKVLASKSYPSLFRVLNLLLLLFVVYGGYSIISGVVIMHGGHVIKNGSYLIGPLRTFLPIYTFYLFTRLGYLDEKKMRFWFWPLFFVACLGLYMNTYVRYGVRVNDLFTNNAGYMVACLFPFVFFFYKNPKLQYVITGALLLLSIMSLKRGAMLVAVLSALVFFTTQKISNWKQRATRLIVLGSILLFVGRYVYLAYQGSENFQYRIEMTLQGNDSNRTGLRNQMLSRIQSDDSLVHYLFGYGADGSLRVASNYAHNDWLEILVCQGLLGVLIYLMFWLSFYKMVKRTEKRSLEYDVFLVILLAALVRTMFSMWYSNTSISVTMPMGYCLAVYYEKYILPKKGKVNI